MVAVVTDGRPGGAIAVPVDAPLEVERLARANRQELVWTKLAASELMAASAEDKVTFAGNTQGGFVFPSFLPAFDAIASFVHLLSLLARSGRRLSHTVSQLRRPEIVRAEVTTPFELKGVLMRLLLERASAKELVLVDGVKLVDEDEWTLVVPDTGGPSTSVTAEGETFERAERRATEMADQIASILAEASG
jgi:mannose-1-phosphate guanylyltransferase/phosphomannomutase